MEKDQADRVLSMLQANWPTFATSNDANDLWVRYFQAHDFGVCARAATKLIGEDERPPTVARFQDAARATLAELGGRNLETGECPVCDDGWVWIEERSKEHPHGLVKRCPNGCAPNAKARSGQR
jgi:hypothetical protein